MREVLRFVFTYVAVAFTFMVFIGKTTHTFDYMWIAFVLTVILMIPDVISRLMGRKKKEGNGNRHDANDSSDASAS